LIVREFSTCFPYAKNEKKRELNSPNIATVPRVAREKLSATQETTKSLAIKRNVSQMYLVSAHFCDRCQSRRFTDAAATFRHVV